MLGVNEGSAYVDAELMMLMTDDRRIACLHVDSTEAEFTEMYEKHYGIAVTPFMRRSCIFR